MKTSLLFLASLVAPFFGQAASVSSIVPGTQSNVTLTLTSTYSEVVSDTLTVHSEKLVTARYSNRELLSDLLAEGVLGDTTISGWKIVLVNRSPLFSAESDYLLFYALKSGRSPVLIPPSRLYIDTDTSAAAEATTEKFKDRVLKSSQSKFVAVISLGGRRVLDAANDSYDDTFSLKAVATGDSALAVRKLKVGDITQEFSFNLLGAVKLSPIIGQLKDNTRSYDAEPIQGSIGFSAFSPLDISAYPAPEQIVSAVK